MMYGRGYNGFSNCFGYGYGFMNSGIGMILTFAFILLATIAVIYFVTRINRNKPANSALDILKSSLAKGEISEEEFLRRKNLID